MAVHGRGENPREHHVNNKSQHHKKQLQSVNSGLSFMKQKGTKGISTLVSIIWIRVLETHARSYCIPSTFPSILIEDNVNNF
ncbi:hypothetical protein CIB84_001085 [Bambusicola thoracicus]|uniref:Uncharacterized protein n=1 Tax=Bambusicola thoracicus TaxID=9083 RepID=A0A2P4TFL0_BAMTH|nr:hypothetical protein CIB84_001085 [Bambusicola thoracicus]